MKRLVRLALAILAATALGSPAGAQVRAVPHTPPPVHPLPLPMPMMPNVGLTGRSLTIAPAPNVVLTIPQAAQTAPSSAAVPVPVQVVPPPPPPEEPPPDGEEHCEDRDGNALNDPDDCRDDGSTAPDNAANAIDADAPAAIPVDDSLNSVPDNAASEPAAAGWRPSWWMIVLGVVAVLFLLGWIGDRRR